MKATMLNRNMPISIDGIITLPKISILNTDFMYPGMSIWLLTSDLKYQNEGLPSVDKVLSQQRWFSCVNLKRS